MVFSSFHQHRSSSSSSPSPRSTPNSFPLTDSINFVCGIRRASLSDTKIIDNIDSTDNVNDVHFSDKVDMRCTVKSVISDNHNDSDNIINIATAHKNTLSHDFHSELSSNSSIDTLTLSNSNSTGKDTNIDTNIDTDTADNNCYAHNTLQAQYHQQHHSTTAGTEHTSHSVSEPSLVFVPLPQPPSRSRANSTVRSTSTARASSTSRALSNSRALSTTRARHRRPASTSRAKSTIDNYYDPFRSTDLNQNQHSHNSLLLMGDYHIPEKNKNYVHLQSQHLLYSRCGGTGGSHKVQSISQNFKATPTTNKATVNNNNNNNNNALPRPKRKKKSLAAAAAACFAIHPDDVYTNTNTNITDHDGYQTEKGLFVHRHHHQLQQEHYFEECNNSIVHTTTTTTNNNNLLVKLKDVTRVEILPSSHHNHKKSSQYHTLSSALKKLKNHHNSNIDSFIVTIFTTPLDTYTPTDTDMTHSKHNTTNIIEITLYNQLNRDLLIAFLQTLLPKSIFHRNALTSQSLLNSDYKNNISGGGRSANSTTTTCGGSGNSSSRNNSHNDHDNDNNSRNSKDNINIVTSQKRVDSKKDICLDVSESISFVDMENFEGMAVKERFLNESFLDKMKRRFARWTIRAEEACLCLCNDNSGTHVNVYDHVHTYDNSFMKDSLSSGCTASTVNTSVNTSILSDFDTSYLSSNTSTTGAIEDVNVGINTSLIINRNDHDNINSMYMNREHDEVLYDKEEVILNEITSKNIDQLMEIETENMVFKMSDSFDNQVDEEMENIII